MWGLHNVRSSKDVFFNVTNVDRVPAVSGTVFSAVATTENVAGPAAAFRVLRVWFGS